MSPEYLFEIPIHILHLYIQLFNEKQEEEANQAKKMKGGNKTPSSFPGRR